MALLMAGKILSRIHSPNFQIYPGLNANETQIPYDKHRSVLTGEKSPKHTQFCQIWSIIIQLHFAEYK